LLWLAVTGQGLAPLGAEPDRELLAVQSALRAGGATARVRAARAAALRGDRWSVVAGDLVRLLDSDEAVADAAAWALRCMGEAAVPHLEAALTHQRPAVRQASALLFARLDAGRARASAILADRLRSDPDINVRIASAMALRSIPGPLSAEAIRVAVRSDNPALSLAARRLWWSRAGDMPEAASDLVATLRGAESDDLVHAAALEAGALGGAPPEVMDALSESAFAPQGPRYVRLTALLSLLRLRPTSPRIIESCLGFIDGSSAGPGRQDDAMESLAAAIVVGGGDLSGERERAAARALSLETANAPRRMRLELQSFGLRALPMLSRLLSSESMSGAIAAARTLGDMGSLPEVRGALRDGARRARTTIARAECAVALCRLGDPSEAAVIGVALDDAREPLWAKFGLLEGLSSASCHIDMVDQLVKMSSDGDNPLRLVALKALGPMCSTSTKAVAALRLALTSRDERVVAQAAAELARMEALDRQTLPLLAGALESRSLRTAAVEGLTRMGVRGAAVALRVRPWLHGYAIDRAMGANLLAAMEVGDPEVVLTLCDVAEGIDGDLLQDAGQAGRLEALRSLAELGGRASRALPALERIQRTAPETVMRRTARAVIEDLRR
jgi:hypothetical protein